MINRPDLDDYRYLAGGLPVVSLAFFYVVLRGSRYGGMPWAALGLGLVVGLALVSVLVVLLHMWRQPIARAVEEVGNPRLPVAFTVAVGLYFVGVLVGAGMVAGPGGPGAWFGFLGAAFLPWALVNWPMYEIRRRADDLYEARRRERWSGREKPPEKQR